MQLSTFIVDSMKSSTIVAIVTLIPILLIFFGVLICCLVRYCNRRSRAKTDTRNLTNSEVEIFTNGTTFLDPHHPLTFIDSRPFNSNLEIPRNLLELGENGISETEQGKFGIVEMRGFLKIDHGGRKQVRVKTVLPSVDVHNFIALLTEIKIMGYLEHHENIVALFGASIDNIKERQVWGAFEFCPNGTLLDYVKTNKHLFLNLFTSPRNSVKTPTYINVPRVDFPENAFSTMELLEFSKGIVNGMNYLAKKDVIHGDLCAKNILLTESMQVKISNFGLPHQLLEYSNYAKKQTAPFQEEEKWKWMAIESLRDFKFSTETDSWSFAVVLWELFSLGETPYSGFAWSTNFLDQLTIGYRLKRPEFASKAVYGIMLDCWENDATRRPSFQNIQTRILHVIEDMKNFHGLP